MPYITQSRRAAIVKRDSHGAAQIGVSKIDNAGELAFVLNFLFQHYAYKRSKGSGGLKFETLAEIAGAVKVAYDEFNREVVVPKEQVAQTTNGKVGDVKAKVNPYSFIERDDDDFDDD